jgi:hypothetical protein
MNPDGKRPRGAKPFVKTREKRALSNLQKILRGRGLRLHIFLVFLYVHKFPRPFPRSYCLLEFFETFRKTW